MFHLFETYINKALALDPRSQQRLLRLQGKTIQLRLTDFSLFFEFEFALQGIKLSNVSEGVLIEPHCRISGSMNAYLALLLWKDPIFAAKLGLTITGDTLLAEEVNTLFLDLDLDWEEPLSQLSNDFLAHQFITTIKKSKQKAKNLFKSGIRSTSEYLQEETRVSITKPEVNEFTQSVDTIRMDVERLEARIALLENKRGFQEA